MWIVLFYANDAAVFVAPTKGDIENFTSILATFGDVISLSANSQESLVGPIRCEDVDLDENCNRSR
jgi:hypothetical protein